MAPFSLNHMYARLLTITNEVMGMMADKLREDLSPLIFQSGFLSQTEGKMWRSYDLD